MTTCPCAPNLSPMTVQPIRYNVKEVDLSARFGQSTVVVASPALAAETIIASLAFGGFGDTSVQAGVDLTGWAAFVVGTSGTTVDLRLRQTNVTGSVVAATDVVNVSAGNKYALTVVGFDPSPGVATYVLTMQVANGAAASTVSATELRGVVI